MPESRLRVNAMRAFWWPAGDLDVVEKSKSLCANPRPAEFASLHLIGQQYEDRDDSSQDFPLPNSLLKANTLRTLAKAFNRDLGEFLRLNHSLERDPDRVIDPGTSVHVPDPGLAPLLAARFAAELLVVPGLSGKKRAELIRSLVPVSAPNPTALDTVLARLLLAEQPTDLAVLDSLSVLAPMPKTT